MTVSDQTSEVKHVNAQDGTNDTARTQPQLRDRATPDLGRPGRRFRVLLLEPPNLNGDSFMAGLGAVGYEIERVTQISQALEVLEHGSFDLAILEISLPDAPRAGLELLHVLREQSSQVPVMLIGRSALLRDRLVALDAGCDDYLVRPVALEELRARARAVLRRAQPNLAYNLDTQGEVHLDWSARLARVQDELVPLTTVEFDLLEMLASQPGQVFSSRQLASFGLMELNAVMERIGSIRRKLGPRVIETVRGRGYRLGMI
jgi:DNA-binding response OmpR family regulator